MAGWLAQARQRARMRLDSARRGGALPPFEVDWAKFGPTGQVVRVEAEPTVDDGLPRGVRVAGAWAWRLILFIAAAYLLLRLIGVLRVVIIPVIVALLLAALLEPAA